MWIPLPKLLRQLRNDAHRQRVDSVGNRAGIALWAGFARRPALYRWFTRLALKVLRLLGDKSGRIRRLPMVGGWTHSRDLPAPAEKSFIEQWRASKRGDGHD